MTVERVLVGPYFCNVDGTWFEHILAVAVFKATVF
ncbi:MAG: hypothetical protein K0S66_2976 [Sphingomonas sp.]|nr:hypothetical protein [Sphingomonas sp.]